MNLPKSLGHFSPIISNIGWEYGIEAFMERPSYQDLMITPLVGSSIGELFYRLKRNIVNNGYRLWGSSVAGNIVAFLIDPVNEVVGLLSGNDARRHARYVNEYNAVVRSSRFSLIDNISSTPFAYDRGRVCPGLTLKITF